jgi:hypothetical protein
VAGSAGRVTGRYSGAGAAPPSPTADDASFADATSVGSSEVVTAVLSTVWPAATKAPAATAATITRPRTVGEGAVIRCLTRVPVVAAHVRSGFDEFGSARTGFGRAGFDWLSSESSRPNAAATTGDGRRWPRGERCRAKTCLPFRRVRAGRCVDRRVGGGTSYRPAVLRPWSWTGGP